MENGKPEKIKRELETILPEDLLIEILLRLPIKSLGQCKCLSKHWKTQISHHLTRTRLDQYPKPNSTLLLNRSNDLIIVPCHKGDLDSISRAAHRWLKGDCLAYQSRVVGTHHGLICFSDYVKGDVYVWNPVMKQKRTFHFQRHQSYNSYNTFFGFGFDTINDDYKVVKISTQSEVYLTIEICEFRKIETRLIELSSARVPFMLCNATTPVTVNGSSHWIAFHPKNRNLQIVRFDMNLENFVEIPFSYDMPNINYDANAYGVKGLNLGRLSLEGFKMDGKRFRLGAFKGSLCLFVSNSLNVEIWLMNCKNRDDSHVGWTRVFEIPISRRIAGVVGFTANEEIVIYNENNIYYAYDPWKDRLIFPLGRHFTNQMLHQTVAYVESLVYVGHSQ